MPGTEPKEFEHLVVSAQVLVDVDWCARSEHYEHKPGSFGYR